ncbi:hypothetical protein ACROYT_G029064 [Oculina patagonica]
MSESEDRAKLLNELFKSLGEVDEESQKWKEYHESALNILQLMHEFMGSKVEIVKARVYGSSAENLKIYSFDDVGDLDLLLFLGEDYVVDECMLEYLPTNPAFVKIKGTGHPLLQSILAEDTEYISTSEIKDLNPFVDSYLFGATVLPRIVKLMTSHLPEPPLNSSVRERNADSPALTCDFSTLMDSRDVLSRRLEQLKQLNIQNLDPGELELIPATLCAFGQVDYTPQHAEVFDDFVQHLKDSVQSLCSNPGGIIQGIPSFAREIWSSEKAKEIRDRFCNIENGTEIESGSKQEDKSMMAVTPEAVARDENENRSSNCRQADHTISSSDFAENVHLEQTLGDEGMEGCVGGKDVNSHDTSKAKLHGHERVAENDIHQVENLCQDHMGGSFSQIFKSIPEEDMEAFLDWLKKEKEEEFFDFLKTAEPVRELQFPYSDESQKCTQSLSFDVVPALQARGWPKVAREWINRRRKWPSPDTVYRIIQEGFHIVVKPPKSGGCPETDFRLSFSHAEFLLSQELNDIQRQCYRGLKKYHSVYLRTEPKCLVTYHLKTIFLQTCEKTGAEMWTEENRTACMMNLLANLHKALTKKYLSHFFITACNLLDMENIETPLLLESLAVKVEQFMRNPMAFSPNLIPVQGTRRPGEEAIAKQGKDIEASTENTLPRSDPKQCGLLAKKNEEKKASPSQEQASRTKSGTAKDAIRINGSRETRTTSLKGARFHDLKDLYIRTCLELLTMAVEDGSTEELDPLERSLVEEIRELISVYNFRPEKLMEEFESRWQLIYQRMFLNCEFNTKEAMLAAMKNEIKLIKHMVLGDGVLGSPRDYSLVFPVDGFVNVYGRMKRMLSSVEPKQPTAKMDDIPLD